MRRRPSATVRVLTRPDLHPDAVRIEVDCPASCTGLTSIPAGPVKLTQAQLITSAVFEHEARCGECSTEDAHRHGDPAIRAETERLHAVYRQHQLRRATAGRVN